MPGEYQKIPRKKLIQILDDIKEVKIALYGDFCLDAYWIMDPAGSEISVETGLKAEAVKKHYYSPGGASNIAANLAALGPAAIRAIGVTGDDIFGRELRLHLDNLGIDISSLQVQKNQFDTYTFTKKYLNYSEEPRIDFGVFNSRTEETDNYLLENIKSSLDEYDVLIFNQQVPGSITNPGFIDRFNEIAIEYPGKIIIVDSRHYASKFHHVIRKMNEWEVAALNGIQPSSDEYIELGRLIELGENIFIKDRKPVFITCGYRGIIVIDTSGSQYFPALQFMKNVDTVGAGDTGLSALALCLAAGYSPGDAAFFSNLATGVTVQKMFTTGTATGAEILEISRNPDYIHHPDLAHDHRKAEFIANTKIERCTDEADIRDFKLKYVFFDHDGTISLLRTGWENVMEKIMIRYILGDKKPDPNDRILNRIISRVKEYIDRSTGLRTIEQMETLVDLIKEFQFVPNNQILSSVEYKKYYLDELNKYIRERISKVEKGVILPGEWIIGSAVEFLKALKERGVRLFLFSGTDQPEVIKEAEILGYKNFFDGGIYGAKDENRDYTKKWVLDQAVKKYNISGKELMVVGDGPVEIRECRRKDGLAVGVASDEENRGSINSAKRKRLIEAGADLILPDFSEYDVFIKRVFREG